MADIQYLDPEIANEGAHASSGFFGLDPNLAQAAPNADGDWGQDAPYQPFIDPPRIPDYKFVASSVQGGKPHPLRKYFVQYTGIPYRYQPLPVWVYRAGHEPRLLTTPKQAEAHGIQLAPNKLGLVANGDWKIEPVGIKTFDAERPGAGKSPQTKPRAEADQAALMAAIVSSVLGQLGIKPGTQNALAGPASADPDYAEFQAFKEWKAGKQTAAEVVKLTPEEERAALVKIAAEAKVKVKDDWSLDKIKAELDKAK